MMIFKLVKVAVLAAVVVAVVAAVPDIKRYIELRDM
jgi:hypothetical protein